MLKVEFKLDEEKIIAEAQYSLDSMHEVLDNAFSKYQFRKEELSDGSICYYGNGKPRDYGAFGLLITTLSDVEWFMNNLTKWLWYNSDDGRDEDDFAVEDILYFYTKKESVV